ncbi:MAG: transglycosylase SLT domain-containing protein [Ardenticatenaceae bacterium]|nr:transglycosylase SLT domain-containing protein [Ardenticatenaceae bacterium]
MGYYDEMYPAMPLPVWEPLRMVLILVLAVLVIGGLVLIRPQVQAQAVVAVPETAVSDTEPAPIVEAVPETAVSQLSSVFTPEVRYWEDEIVAWAAEFDLDPNIVATIMQIESCGDATAVSRAGAQGLFQVMPFHFVAGEDPLDPDTNARRGLAYFVERLQQTGGDVGQAFAGYNGGHVAAAGSWETWAAETRAYYTWTTGIYNDIQAGLTDSPTLRDWQTNGGGSYCQLVHSKLGLTP